MKIGVFYNVLLTALKNKEIESIEEGMSILAKMGICYYEVDAATISTQEEETVLVSALEKNKCTVGNLYFKRDIFSTDEKSEKELMDYTKEILEQCSRLRSKKLMPVITIHTDDEKSSQVVRDYYKAVSELSDEQGIVTVFENNTNSKTKCFSLDDIKQMLENSDKLLFVLDTGNYWFSKENADLAIEKNKGKIARVHLKDIMPCDNSTPDDANIKVHYATLGQGVSSINKCIKLLQKRGYDRGFTIEIDNSNPILPRVQKSVEVIRQSESELQMLQVAEEYHCLLFKYANEYEKIGDEIELKTLHMLSVAALMKTIATKLNVDSRMQKLAIITGLFHDIGRYEQFKQYGTFRDSISTDHADLSAEIIKKEGLLFDLSKAEQEMVLTAIKNHNKYSIEDGLDKDTILLCKMIRDADKIDCFRVVSSEAYETSYDVSQKELEESEISEEVFENIINHKLVNNTDRKYPLDYILSCCAFVFDVNFDISREIILEKNKYLCRLDKLSYTNKETAEKLETIFEEIRRYLSDGRMITTFMADLY